DRELAAVVLVRVGEEQGCRQIGPDSVGGSRDLPNRVVDVAAKGATACVSVEERRKDAERKRGGDEERMPLQRLGNGVAQFTRDGMIFRQLQIVLRARGLWSRGHAAIDPVRGVERSPR